MRFTGVMMLAFFALLPAGRQALPRGGPTFPAFGGPSLIHAGGRDPARQSVAVRASGFIFEKAPFPQCHASTIVEVAPGRFVAAWFGGTREGSPDVGIWVSRHVRGRWEPPAEVAKGVEAGNPRQPTWNPVLFKPSAGPLILFYKMGPSPSRWWGMWMTSQDEGATWTAPRRLPDGVLGPIKNKPAVLPDGTWLAPSSTEDPAAGWQVRFEISRNAGRTWEVVGPIDKGPGLEAIQPTILFHPNRRLQAICRTRNGVLATTWSQDSGRTWTDLAPTQVPNPNSGVDAVTLADGRHLLVYNHSQPAPGRSSGPRYPLNVAVSRDGLAWSTSLTLEDRPMPDGYAYPAVIQASDGLVHITYTWNRQRIKHVVLDPR